MKVQKAVRNDAQANNPIFLCAFFLLACLVFGTATAGWSAISCQYPNQTIGTECKDASSADFVWPTSWTSISATSENETSGDCTAGDQYNFVGNTVSPNNCPGLYYSKNGTYVFFRVRVNLSTAVAAGTFAGSQFLYIRTSAPGSAGNRYPQYALTWDSWSGSNATHGLEMQKNNGTANTWDRVTMDDVDGFNAKKYAADIDGEAGGTATFTRREGYVRTVDGISCSGLGTTTFIDFAVKCTYFARADVISAGVPNLCTSPLYVQAGSLKGQNDHNAIGTSNVADVARGVATLTVDGQVITVADWASATLIELLSFTAKPSGDDVILNWETASEIDNAGFHLWKSTNEAGPYAKITSSLIPAKGGPAQGASYSYTDPDVQKGNLYYKLEDIDNNGVSTFHGPVSVFSDSTSNAAGSGDGGGGCFIATAAFGSPLAGQVEILRQFRDKYLLSHALGRMFVSWYYRHSPAVASFIKANPAAQMTVRAALYPLIGFSALLLSGWLPLAAAGLLLAALLYWRFGLRRRRAM